MSENTGNLQIFRMNIPKHYPKLLHPVHSNDKMSILNFFDFPGLTLFGLGLIKINAVLANFNNPRPLLILNN